MERIRHIVFYKSYFSQFFDSLKENIRQKVDYVLFMVTVSERIPQKFFRHIEGSDGLYEIRVEYQGNIYRIFCCFDEGKVVVLFNGFQKKSQKTPPEEIERASKIMVAYFDEKQKLKDDGGKNKKK